MSEGKGLSIQWLGHASLLITTPAGTNVLVDPWFEGNPKYPGTPLPEQVDLIVVTHGHSDHTASVVSLAKKYSAPVLGMVELTMLLAKQGVENPVGMNIGGTFQHKDLAFTMVEARHSSSYEIDGVAHYAGDPAGFIVEIEGARTLYLAGDTAVFSDMKLIAEMYRPEIALLPIGDHYTMGPRGASVAASFLVPKVILPIHWGTFPALTGTPAALKEELSLRGTSSEVIAWSPGETYSA
jgi:L-ascorbate metabolism protein UlaG (beta-lactamase superfamily)